MRSLWFRLSRLRDLCSFRKKSRRTLKLLKSTAFLNTVYIGGTGVGLAGSKTSETLNRSVKLLG
jgi:hypothetical protein